MSIEFNCPNCEKFLKTDESKAGARAKCPGCGQSITIPQLAGTAAPPPAAADDEWGDEASWEAESYEAELPSATDGDTRPCPVCGESIKAAAIRCRFCGADLGAGAGAGGSGGSMPAPRMPSGPGGGYLQPHRGTLILVFSILSWFICIIFGIVAWVLANNDLAEMQAGRMDPSGEGLTKAGKIISIVHICFAGFVIVAYCLIVIVVSAGGNF